MSPALNLVDAYEDYKDLPGIRSDAKVKTRVNDNYSNAGFDTGYTDYIKVNKDTPYDLFNGIAYGDEKKRRMLVCGLPSYFLVPNGKGLRL